MKVIATRASKMYNKAIKELHRVVEEGEIFEVTPERFEVLNGGNQYNVIFVEKYEVDPPKPDKEVVKIESKCKEPKAPKVNTEPEIYEEPEIFIIEPGKDPIQVDKDLKPIKKTSKKSGKKSSKKKVESSEG